MQRPCECRGKSPELRRERAMPAPASATRAAHGQHRDSRDSFVGALEIGRGARVGATVQDIEEADSKQTKSGVAVETVEPGGPADKAGMKAGDAVTEFDGERVRSVRQFLR